MKHEKVPLIFYKTFLMINNIDEEQKKCAIFHSILYLFIPIQWDKYSIRTFPKKFIKL